MSAIEDCGHDVTDVETGRDLIVTIKEGTNGNAITIGYALESTPLTTDETKLAEWTSDVRTWENVYSVKNYEYLAIIVKGYVPMWDKELNKWVPKTETVSDGIEDEVDMGEELPKLTQEPTNVTTETKTKTTATKTTTKTVAVVEDEDEDDDLPF